MPGSGHEITFRLEPDRNNRQLIIPLSVGQDIVLDMLPVPQATSVISRRALQMLIAGGQIGGDGPSYVLSNLRIKGQAIPDLTVRVSAGPAMLGVDGIIGESFFSQFASVTWVPGSRLLTLVTP